MSDLHTQRVRLRVHRNAGRTVCPVVHHCAAAGRPVPGGGVEVAEQPAGPDRQVASELGVRGGCVAAAEAEGTEDRKKRHGLSRERQWKHTARAVS